MQSKAEFYLADVGEMNPKTGAMKVTPNVLHFSLKRPHYSDPEKIDTLYDNIARPEHVENYSSAFATFMVANPSYKLPWAKEPVVEAPVVSEPDSDAPVRPSKSRHSKSVE